MLKIKADKESVPGTLDMRWEYTLDVGIMHMHTETYPYAVIPGAIQCWRWEETGEVAGNPHRKTCRTLHDDNNLTSDSSQAPWSCEAETLPALEIHINLHNTVHLGSLIQL